jgi:hypothetical protein
MKLSLNARARIVAESYLSTVSVSLFSIRGIRADLRFAVRLNLKVDSAVYEVYSMGCRYIANGAKQ